MKDIITDLSISETRWEATEKWREYTSASKIYRDPQYIDLRKIYNQVKQGRKVIDIFKVIQKGGISNKTHPRLAIAQIKTKILFCEYYDTGTVVFINRKNKWNNNQAGKFQERSDVRLPACLPTFDRKRNLNNNPWGYTDTFHLSAPVPPIPPSLMPKKVTGDYYILWEVDEWK